MKHFYERLAWAMRCAKMDPSTDQSKLARLVGCSPQAIQHLLDPDKNAKSSRFTAQIAAALGCDPSWLSTGTGVAPSDIEATAAPLKQPTDDEFAYVSQLDVYASCGDGRFTDHVVVKGGLAFKRSSLKDFGVPESAARIIYASGGSMSPTIKDGCVVLINTADTTPQDGRVYAICQPDDGLVLKRLIRDYHPSVGGLAWIMRSDNPDKVAHPDKLLPPDDRTSIAGRAVWNDNRL